MKNIILIVIAIVIILGGIWYFASTKPSNYVVPTTPALETSQPVTEEQLARVIVAADSGFSPSSIAIQKGEAITFRNEGLQLTWPASAVHPTHTVYPGSDIKKCGTQGQEMIFDACKGLAKGEAWSFTFNSIGSWKYHDHLNVSHYGTIIVE